MTPPPRLSHVQDSATGGRLDGLPRRRSRLLGDSHGLATAVDSTSSDLTVAAPVLAHVDQVLVLAEVC